MLGFLKRLFASDSASSLIVEAYWCETPIKLPAKVQTPLGSNVSVVKLCVDIHYSIDGDRVLLHQVKMARGGSSIMGSSASINIASDRTGEAWFTSYLCPEQNLAEAVENDLSSKGSRLCKIMFGKWREANRGELVKSLADALNAQAPPDQIADLIANAGRGNEIVFTYTKPNGDSGTRHVTVEIGRAHV